MSILKSDLHDEDFSSNFYGKKCYRKPAIIGTNRHNSGKQEFESELIKKI